MATSESSRVSCSRENNCNSCLNISKCTSCEVLQDEVSRIALELKSAREIIRNLQESIKQNIGSTVTPRPKMAETWTRVRKGRHGNKTTQNQNNIVLTPVSNSFSALENLEDEKETKCSTDIKHIGQTQKKTRVVVIGDSHARGCAENLKENLLECYVTGYVKPGAQTDQIVKSAKSDIDGLTKNDVVVVLGGTNDIGKNNSKQGIRNLVSFAKECQHTNLIVMSASNRHDLVNWSCVNTEVKKFNVTLKRRLKTFENTRVLDMNSERAHYTRHGLHLNKFGKKILANKVSAEVRRKIVNQRKEPIVLRWIEDAANVKKEDFPGSDMAVIRRSERTKKPPQKLSNDFL